MKELFLLRGLPGAGKSSLAKSLGAGSGSMHLEADMYFIDSKGKYKFDATQLKQAHAWCQDTVEFAGFDVTVNGEYLHTHQTEVAIEVLMELPHVEILHDGNWSQEVQDKFVFKNFIKGTKVPHEGIVIKHITGDRKKVAKVINPDYLIYGEKNDVGDSH